MSATDSFDDLHEDDELAFVQLVAQFDDALTRSIENSGDETDINHFYLNYINDVLAAARGLEVDAFSSWTVPRHQNAHIEFRDFSLFVKSFVMQVRIRNSRERKIYSVSLDIASKARIHHLVGEIKKLGTYIPA